MRWRDVKQHKTTQKTEQNNTKDEKLHLPYASNLEKFKAFVTDSFLLSMPLFYGVIYLIFGGREGFSQNMSLGWLYILGPLGIIVTLFYFIAGQTPGMKAYEIKVVDNKTGKKPNIIISALRFIFFNLVFFSVIGLLFALFRKDHRGIHDLLSGTSVIKAPNE